MGLLEQMQLLKKIDPFLYFQNIMKINTKYLKDKVKGIDVK